MRRLLLVPLVVLAVSASGANGSPPPTVTAATCKTDAAFRTRINTILSRPVSPTTPYKPAHALAAFRRAGISLPRENDLLDLYGNVPNEQLCDFRWYGSRFDARHLVWLFRLHVLSTPATAKREQAYHLTAARRNHDTGHLVTRVRGNVLGELQLPSNWRGAIPKAALTKLDRAMAAL